MFKGDRISIVLNLDNNNKDSQLTSKCLSNSSFFGIFCGFGGSVCSHFLCDNLHHFIINNSNFPTNPVEAIKKGFETADNYFLNNIAIGKNVELKDRSSASAIICLIIGNCYLIN